MPEGVAINGKALAELRALAGMEQLDLANAACVENPACRLTPQNVSAYEREVKRPGAVTLEAIVKALMRGLARRGLMWVPDIHLRALIRTPTLDAASNGSVGKEGATHRRQAGKVIGLGGLAAALSALGARPLETPGPVAPELVGYFRDQLTGHYRADLFLGPRHLIATAVTQYWLIDELAAAATGDVRRDLLRLAVAYAEEAGWLYQDAGELSRSSYWRGQSLEMAHRCHDPQLVSYALTRKAMLRRDLRDGQGVVDLTSAALAGERALCPKARLIAMVEAAHGQALLGKRGACERLLEGVATLTERVDDDYPWGNAFRWSPVFLDLQRATCLGQMGLAADSAQLWDRILNLVPPGLRRDYGVYRARQATALASSGEPEHAVYVAAEVVPLVLQTGSARMRTELLTLREAMAPWQHDTPGHDLAELLAGV